MKEKTTIQLSLTTSQSKYLELVLCFIFQHLVAAKELWKKKNVKLSFLITSRGYRLFCLCTLSAFLFNSDEDWTVFIRMQFQSRTLLLSLPASARVQTVSTEYQNFIANFHLGYQVGNLYLSSLFKGIIMCWHHQFSTAKLYELPIDEVIRRVI